MRRALAFDCVLSLVHINSKLKGSSLSTGDVLRPNLRILVRASNWIGDAVMTTPALMALRRLYPNAHISVLARPWVGPVFYEHPAVDEVIPYIRDNAISARLVIAGSLRARNFDLAILFPNSFDSALIVWLAHIPRRVGYATDCRRLLLTSAVPVPREYKTRHEVYYYLGLVDSIRQLDYMPYPSGEIDLESPLRLSLVVPGHGKSGAIRILKDLGVPQGTMLIGLNPGAAYGPAKCWPADRFSALGRALMERLNGCHILVFGTDRDRPLAGDICAPLGKRGHNLAGKTDLAEAMGLISMLNLFVTNDSGLMHIGAALDVPMVAIFGSTDPVRTGPWSDNSRVVRHELPCSPCLKRTCPRDFKCMLGIGVDEVLDACLQQIKIGITDGLKGGIS